MTNQISLTAIDLFCGCGGLTSGLIEAGFHVVGAVDIDPLSLRVYKVNHPDVTVWQTDIRKLSVSMVKRKLGLRKGMLDLLAGCPPCQGFSTLRTLNGSRVVDDSRNDLLTEFQRFAEELRPKAIMLENVPGLAADQRFANFCEILSDLGYLYRYRILDAADYGVPQRRRRLILLAGIQCHFEFPPAADTRPTVRHAIGFLPPPGVSGDILHDLPEKRTLRIQQLIRRIPKDGGGRTSLPRSEQLPCHIKCNGFKDVYGRMAWDDVSPTITSGCFNPSKGRFLHPTEDRTITMREAALLQGFPNHYQFPDINSKSSLALLIGNAMPSPFAAAHAKAIHQALTKRIRRKNMGDLHAH